MAVDYQFRPSNKEPDWSSICNNVFDQHLDPDYLFAFDGDHRGRSSSNDSTNLFDFSTGSEQSHQTSGTSPVPSLDHHVDLGGGPVVERQPREKEPVTFWTKTLKTLEQNAVECEKKQQRLRSTKSHPDFLSLGGCPSPPAMPASPTDQSSPTKSRRPRGAANGRKASQARSVSRGRLAGVTKPTQATVNPYTTVRKCSASPPKMMNPSRYRAGFEDVWADRIQGSAKDYQLRVAPQMLPESPPPSARLPREDNFAAFGSPSLTYPTLSAYDDQLSPLTNTLQQAHIRTPIASPSVNAAALAGNGFYEPLLPVANNPYATQPVPLNDTAPLFPEHSSSLAPNTPQAFDFDFGFSSPRDNDPWNESLFVEPYPGQKPYGDTDPVILPSTEQPIGLPPAGLGISCNPALVSNLSAMADNAALPNTSHYSLSSTPYHAPAEDSAATPTTPRGRARARATSRQRSESPSPPATDSRAHRATSRSRRTSRHRRAKSMNATPRPSQNAEKGGFVNFTPQDSNRILSGVAPSGSSKTKARREKEAADKRRRFSQAAVRAVVEAGGDLNALSKVGLLI